MALRSWFKRPKPAVAVDLLGDAFIADPYPIYHAVEAAGGIAPTTPSGHMITGHARITKALSHPGFGNTPSRFSALNPKNARKHVAASVAANTLPFVDGTRHQHLRKATGSAIFKAINAFDTQLQPLAHQSMDAVQDIRQFAGHFALSSTLAFLGLPLWNTAQARGFTDAFFRLFAPMTSATEMAETNRQLQAFRDAIAADVAQEDSLFSAWCTHIPAEEAMDMTMLLLADGVENVEAGLQTAALALAARSNLLMHSNDMTALAREILRWDSPAQLLPRVCLEDTEFEGHQFSAGAPVFLALGSANRDPAQFQAPDEIRPDRDTSSALIFGQGRHSCIGQGLAVAQIRTGIEVLAEKDLIPTFATYTPGYRARFGHRWPEFSVT